MGVRTRCLLDLFIPCFLLFSSLGAVVLILQCSLNQSGLAFKIIVICNPATFTPHLCRLTYTNFPLVDQLVCGMVVFFHALMDGTGHLPFLVVFFSVLGAVALIPFLEAARGRTLLKPALVGILFQLATMGVVIPLFGLAFTYELRQLSIHSELSFPRSPSSRISQGNAEALLFGFLLGYVLPTGIMLYFRLPAVTAIWQIFPIFIALAAFAHRLIRPPSRLAQSGHATVMVTLTSSFVASALLHAIYVWPILTDTVALRSTFMPIMDALDPVLTDNVLDFFKWDMIFGVGALMLVTLWMADSLSTLLCILVWHGIATIVLGPAAAILGIFLLRERINEQRFRVKID